MAQRLTVRLIERAQPPTAGTQTFLWDSEVRGFGLRITRDGARSFVFQYRAGTRTRRLTIGKLGTIELSTARDIARDYAEQVRRDKDPLAEREAAKREVTVAAAFEDWMRLDQSSNRSAAEVRRVFERYVLPELGRRSLKAVARTDIIRLIDGIAARGSKGRPAPTMANRTLAPLGRFLNWCAGRDLVPLSAAAGIAKPKAEQARDRVLDEQELGLLWAATEGDASPFAAIVRLLLLTGARREEIAALQWHEVEGLDGEAPLIRLSGERTKTGEPRLVPLSALAADILRTRPRTTSPFVFGASGASGFSGFSRALARLQTRMKERAAQEAPTGGQSRQGRPDPAPWRIHDLRRTCATGLQRLGVRLEVTEAVLGHLSGSRSGVVGVYQRHAYETEKRAALDAWAETLLAEVAGRPPASNVMNIRVVR